MILSKLKTRHLTPIEYILNGELVLNTLIGTPIKFSHTGRIFCQKCSKITKNSFGEGFCYACFSTAPEASPCIIHPELCEAHLGKGRDLAYEEKHHNQPHIVYFASTDIIKVGVTRETQVPTRWIDQGAAASIIIAETPNRYLAGYIEVALKEYYADKTNWQSMLRNIAHEELDLIREKWEIMDQLPSDISQYFTDDETLYEFEYPVLGYPETVTSLNFEKNPSIEGVLTGIRGQYLYLDYNRVFNVRRHSGYEIEWL